MSIHITAQLAFKDKSDGIYGASRYRDPRGENG